MLPNALLVGPGRTGTTSLFKYLSRHENIIPSRDKETQVFRPAILGQPVDVGNYKGQFSDCAAGCRLDGSPSYFQGGRKVADAIAKHCPNSRVVITLRDPVERLVSNYNHIKAKHIFNNSYSFENYITSIIDVYERGFLSEGDFMFSGLVESMYRPLLAEWVGVLGPDAILVCFSENIVADPAANVSRILQHFGVNEDVAVLGAYPDTNKSHVVRNPGVHRLAVRLSASLDRNLFALPGAKTFAQRLYYGLNGGKGGDETALRNRAAALLQKFGYDPAELREMISELNAVTPLPNWVRRSR